MDQHRRLQNNFNPKHPFWSCTIRFSFQHYHWKKRGPLSSVQCRLTCATADLTSSLKQGVGFQNETAVGWGCSAAKLPGCWWYQCAYFDWPWPPQRRRWISSWIGMQSVWWDILCFQPPTDKVGRAKLRHCRDVIISNHDSSGVCAKHRQFDIQSDLSSSPWVCKCSGISA